MTPDKMMAESMKSPENKKPRQLPQYVASLSVVLGSVASGLTVGWSSSAGEGGSNLRYSFDIDGEDFSWVTSILSIGSALVCVPTGLLNNLIGRKKAMLFLIVPLTIGWACTIWPNSIATLIIGRLILGIGGGAFFVSIPMYISEIAEKKVRGKLNSFFMLAHSVGILMAYSLGLLDDMFLLSIISAIVPFVFFVIFSFMPETPTYYLMKGNIEAARETLHWLRGSEFDVEPELEEKKKGLEENEIEKVSLFVAIKSKTARKGFLIALGLVFFQAFSGSGAITFYLSSIFANATGNNGTLYSIGVGFMQIFAKFLFGFVIDKWGRKLLLMISGSVMCLSTLGLGTYFYYEENNANIEDFKWAPFFCISLFVAFYSLGFSVIPWMMISELFSSQIKALAASSSCMAGLLMSFIVVKFYNTGKNSIGPHGMFWLFSAVSAVGFFFVYFIVPETKNKTLEQIQKELSGKSESNEASEKSKF